MMTFRATRSDRGERVAIRSMALRTVLATPEWSLERPGQRAHVSCNIALVRDDDDRGFYEIRVALNGELVYMRLHDSHEAVTADAIAARCDLLTAGWMSVEELMQATQSLMTAAD